MRLRARLTPFFVASLTAQGDAAPTFTIAALSAVANVVAMRITASEQVTGFVVGDITISAGGSLASFATADNIVFTVSWTLAAGANTMNINAGVCTDLGGNNNLAATQFSITYLTLQPDATAGNDTRLYGGFPDTNYAADTLLVGKTAFGVARGLIKFDLSSIPAASTVLSAILSLYLTSEASANARTHQVFRTLRAWVEAQATWNIYSTGNSWQTAGGFGALDCEQSNIGSISLSATETINEFKNITLTAASIQAMITGGGFTNNGFLIKQSDETANDSYTFASSDDATAGNRPKFAVVYY